MGTKNTHYEAFVDVGAHRVSVSIEPVSSDVTDIYSLRMRILGSQSEEPNFIATTDATGAITVRTLTGMPYVHVAQALKQVSLKANCPEWVERALGKTSSKLAEMLESGTSGGLATTAQA